MTLFTSEHTPLQTVVIIIAIVLQRVYCGDLSSPVSWLKGDPDINQNETSSPAHL